ncbi:hypothetical protein [Paraliomyxa miuraensis]|uniref:hypothetical protein n=1 Tax=Paraliomyxa miuraensis TaxID=376150 RepID=UPI002254CB6D|nr:hypothetical protein [Paraliomyxa miuraensis]MCX4247871.1 hypothetical protein [Paraliomyxa miuraensis]
MPATANMATTTNSSSLAVDAGGCGAGRCGTLVWTGTALALAASGSAWVIAPGCSGSGAAARGNGCCAGEASTVVGASGAAVGA